MTSAAPLDDVDPTDALAALAAEMQADLDRDRDPSIMKRRYSTGESSIKSTAYEHRGDGRPAPRGVVERAPQFFSGPPRSGHTAGPLALLAEVVEESRRLHDEVRALLRDLTGEEPQSRPVPSPLSLPAAALPRVARLATEIDVVLAEITRLVSHMRRSL